MKRLLLSLALLPAVAGAAAAQGPAFRSSVAAGTHLQSFRFAEGIGARSAELVLTPIAYQQRLGSNGLVELYGAFARGTVQMDGETFTMANLTDTWLRTSWVATPGTTITLGVNLPTGKPTHDNREAVVATVLATDLLGFREASWGTGLGATLGVSSAREIGPWTASLGASYRRSGEFNPRADTLLHYRPGNETRGRAAFQRKIGDDRGLSLGLMVLTYTEDRLDGRNLFQAGTRAMADVSYSFRRGRGEWTVTVADIWRDKGDVTLPIVSQASTVTGDTTFQTGAQNLVFAAIGGSTPLTSRLVIRPGLDFRVQRGEDVGGQGWVLGLGADVPLYAGGAVEVFPSARVLRGELQNREKEMKGIWGLETSLVVRWGRR